MVRRSRDNIIIVIFLVYISIVASLFVAQDVQSQQESSSVVINASVSVTVSITASGGITEGISFGDINANSNNNNGTRNTDLANGNTSYNVSIDGTTDVNVNITQRLNESLTAGSSTIGAGNITTKHNSTYANLSIDDVGSEEVTMSSSSFTDLAVSDAFDCTELSANSVCHITFFFDVPANQPAGDYIANYCFCGYQSTDASAKTSCSCS